MSTNSLTVSNLRSHSVERRDPDKSTLILKSGYALDPYPDNTGVWLHHWAEETPDTIFLAERDGSSWREVSFRSALQQVRSIAAALLENGLDGNKPIAVLSGNSVDHGLLALAAQYVGIPIVPLAEQYALIPAAHDRLEFIANKIKPAMVYVSDTAQFAPALTLDCLRHSRVVCGANGAGTDTLLLSDMAKTPAGGAVDQAHAGVGPDTPAKILFTSGSTSHPKGVITTHRMMCVNQVQLAQSLPFLKDHPPKILDWLPWNHVFGGSHNFNMMLANGGSLYIDDGRPVGDAFARTIENLLQHPGTLSFNVPLGFALLAEAMSTDETLKQAYFSNLDMIFYAGASLPQNVWQKLESFAMEVRGKLPLMISSWGMTETAPATLIVHEPCRRSGVIGVPMPGVEAKLIDLDMDDRYELRVRGPNITPGYFKDEEKTAESFDEDGFLITGDAVKFVDPDQIQIGLTFDGRISEDFKLASGTWVRASTLRLDVMKSLAGIAQDIVVCGQDQNEIGLLIFPDQASREGCTEHDGALMGDTLGQQIKQRLTELSAKATGSSTRIRRALVLAAPPSLQHQEITVKGNLNVRKVLDNRTALVERLYDNSDPATITV